MQQDTSIYKKITAFAIDLMGIDDVDSTLKFISSKANKLLNTQRCSIFVVDSENNAFWTILNDETDMITIPINSGIIGKTYATKMAQLVNNPYETSEFMSSIDKKIDFKTENIITAPIFDSKQEIIAIIELLNKNEGEFNDSDLEILNFFANFISGSLEFSLMDS